MKLFVLSLLFGTGLGVPAPSTTIPASFAARLLPYYYPNANFGPQFYHSAEEANCQGHVDFVPVQSCKPVHDTKCEVVDAVKQDIKYEKECRKIVDVLCGDHTHEDQEVAEDGHSHDGEEATEDTAIAGAQLVYTSGGALVASPYHHCHNVEREHCYYVPVVEEVPYKTKNCWRVQTVQCHDTSVIIPKWVCTPVEDTEEDTEEVTEVRTEEEVEDEATEVEEAEVVEEEEAPVAVPAENEIVEEGEQQDGEESNEVVDAAAEIPTVNLLKFYQPQQQVYYHHPYQPFAFAG